MFFPRNPSPPTVVKLTAAGDITPLGNADSTSAIAMTVAGGAAPHDSTTQFADAEPSEREAPPAPDAASNPIGQSGQPDLFLASGNLAKDGNRADDAGNRRTGDDGARAVSKLMASLPWASRVSESDSPLDAVLSAFGHDRRCRRRVRAGLAVACECSTRQPVDDAAIVIGLALRFARIGFSRRLPLPHGIVDQLARHVGEDDPAAIMVWDWLAGRRFVPARVLSRNQQHSVLRLVCTEER